MLAPVLSRLTANEWRAQLRQHHVICAVANQELRQRHGQAAAQELRQVRNNPHTAAAPYLGGKQRPQAGHLVQAVDHYNAVLVQQPQALKKRGIAHVEPPAEGIICVS